MEKNIYIGNRYVPKIMGVWDNEKTYEGLSIVLWKGNSFTSKKQTPAGIDIGNEEFWVSTGNYNAQIENYRQEVKEAIRLLEVYKTQTDQTLTEHGKKITGLRTDVDSLINDLNRHLVLYETFKGETTTHLKKHDTLFSQTENEIPVTAFFSDDELKDLMLTEPQLNHSQSIQRYVNHMRSIGNFGLRFPAGHYRFKNIDLGNNSWLIKGSFTGSGYSHQTVFNIIAEKNSTGFYGLNRQMTVTNVKAKSLGTKEDTLNTIFYDNRITDGTFMFMSNVLAEGFSGDVVKAFDVIDSEFYRFRVLDNKNVFNFKPNKWVRSTTITFNKVYGERNSQIFDTPYTSQSVIRDCIFEHGGKVGNITNGSWTIDNLYLEQNTGDLDATNSLLTKFYTYSYKGGAILNTQPNISHYDKGDAGLNWKGLNASSVSYDYKKPRTVIDGNYSGTSWVKLGRWHSTSKGGRLKINLLGANNWTQRPTGVDGPIGESTIYLVHSINTDLSIPNTVGFAYHTGGAKPILEAKAKATEGTYRDTFDIFVKVSTEARHVGVDFVLTEGIFIPDVVTNHGYPGDSSATVQDINFEFRIETDKGSFMIGQDGKLSLTHPTDLGGTVPSEAKQYLPINVNGIAYKLPLF